MSVLASVSCTQKFVQDQVQWDFSSKSEEGVRLQIEVGVYNLCSFYLKAWEVRYLFEPMGLLMYLGNSSLSTSLILLFIANLYFAFTKTRKTCCLSKLYVDECFVVSILARKTTHGHLLICSAHTFHSRPLDMLPMALIIASAYLEVALPCSSE